MARETQKLTRRAPKMSAGALIIMPLTEVSHGLPRPVLNSTSDGVASPTFQGAHHPTAEPESRIIIRSTGFIRDQQACNSSSTCPQSKSCPNGHNHDNRRIDSRPSKLTIQSIGTQGDGKVYKDYPRPPKPLQELTPSAWQSSSL